jgi:hypothetical protein
VGDAVAAVSGGNLRETFVTVEFCAVVPVEECAVSLSVQGEATGSLAPVRMPSVAATRLKPLSDDLVMREADGRSFAVDLRPREGTRP